MRRDESKQLLVIASRNAATIQKFWFTLLYTFAEFKVHYLQNITLLWILKVSSRG